VNSLAEAIGTKIPPRGHTNKADAIGMMANFVQTIIDTSDGFATTLMLGSASLRADPPQSVCAVPCTVPYALCCLGNAHAISLAMANVQASSGPSAE